jgi:branched-chain amino acid transport system substrate-binding protein
MIMFKIQIGWKIYSRIAAFVFANALFLISGCSNHETAKELTLGAILPLTGSMAFLGQQELVGLQLGVEDANKRLEGKGIKINLLVEDSQSKAALAATVANKLIDVDKVDALFITTSSATQAVAPLADKAHVPILVMAAEPGLTKISGYMFRIYMNFDDEARTLADYAKQANFKKIKLIRANLQAFDVESKLLRDYLNGATSIVEEHVYEYGSKDFRTIIEKVAATPSDGIFILGVGPELPALVTQLRENNALSKIPVTGGYAFLSEPAQAQGTEIYKNVVFSSFPFTLSSPEMKRFSGYKTQAGTKLGIFTDYLYAYDSVQFLSVAFESRRDSESLYDALKRISLFSGITGNHQINKQREISVSMRMARYVGGEMELLDVNKKDR